MYMHILIKNLARLFTQNMRADNITSHSYWYSWSDLNTDPRNHSTTQMEIIGEEGQGSFKSCPGPGRLESCPGLQTAPLRTVSDFGDHPALHHGFHLLSL
jgi:hypothetical protein